jgi:hypothetical protein
MKRNTNIWKIAAVLVVLTALLLLQSGCAVVGLGIGAAIDAHQPDSVTVQGWRLAAIEQGSRLSVTMTNGSKIAGTFHGGTPATAEWIDTLYMRARSNDPGCAILPALGDTVDFIHNSGQVRGQIKSAVYQLHESESDFCYGCAPVDSSETREFCLRHLRAVRRPDGRLVRSGDIANAIAKSHTFVPYSGIEMVTHMGTQQMPFDCIANVVAYPHKHGKRDGLIIGAIIDLLLLGAFSSFDLGSGSGGGGGWGF